MNNKGFAITTILYGTLILFLFLLLSALGMLNNYKNNLEKLEEETNGARDILMNSTPSLPTVTSNKNYIAYDSSGKSIGEYDTLSDTYNAIISKGATGTIFTNKSNSDSSYLNIISNKKITLNMNGKTITKTATRIENAGTLLVTNGGTINVTSSKINGIATSGSLSITNTSIVNTVTSNAYPTIYQTGSNVTINNATINSKSSNAISQSGAGSITIDGGTVSSASSYPPIYQANNGVITIKNGYVYTDQNTNVINQSGAGTINITGGTVASNYASAIFAAIYQNDMGKVILGIRGSGVVPDSPVLISRSSKKDLIECYDYDACESEYYDGVIYHKRNDLDFNTIETGYKVQTLNDSTYGYKTTLIKR